MSVATLSRTSEELRNVYGRGMNVHSDAYKLPVDAEEHDRLTLQHRIWKLMFGGTGLYPQDVQGTIDRLLAPNSAASSPPAILDLGSGSGIWVVEMAAMYPHAKVVGLDLAEPKLEKHLFPPNCSFVTTDLTKGLDAYRESFDVVHCRCVAGHIVDRKLLMREIVKVLKPGGLLLLADGNLDLYKPDGSRVLPVSPTSPSSNYSETSTGDNKTKSEDEGSWTVLWFRQLLGPLVGSTLDPEHAGGDYMGWQIRQENGLEYVGEKAYFSPLCLRKRGKGDGTESSEEAERQQDLARLTSRNISNYLPASKSILLKAGMPEETVEDWLARACAEMSDQDPKETWNMKWDMAWAVKKEGESNSGHRRGWSLRSILSRVISD